MNTELRIRLRLLDGRKAQPTAVVFDTQSVKTTPVGGERGFDGYKKISGRKRFLLVDTLGSLLLVKIVPANMAETKAAMAGLEKVNEVFSTVTLAWADQGFGGEPFSSWLMKEVGWKLELTGGISTPGKPDFEVAPRRWVVEAIPPVSAASDPSPIGAGLGSRSPSGAAVAARRCMVGLGRFYDRCCQQRR